MHEDVTQNNLKERLASEVRAQAARGRAGVEALARRLLELARLAVGREASRAAEAADDELQDLLETVLDLQSGIFEEILYEFDRRCLPEVDKDTSEQLYAHVESLTEMQFDEEGEYLAFGVNLLVEHLAPKEQKWSKSGLTLSRDIAPVLQDYRLVCDVSEVKVFPELLDSNVAGCLTFSEVRRAATLLRQNNIGALRKLFAKKAESLDTQLGPVAQGATQVLCLFGIVGGLGLSPFPLGGDFYAATEEPQSRSPEEAELRVECLQLAAGALAAALPVSRVVLNDAPFGWWADERAGSRFIRDLLASQRLQEQCRAGNLQSEDLVVDDQMMRLDGRYPQAGLRLHKASDFSEFAVLPFPLLPNESPEEFRTCALELLVAHGIRIFKREAVEDSDADDVTTPTAPVLH